MRDDPFSRFVSSQRSSWERYVAQNPNVNWNDYLEGAMNPSYGEDFSSLLERAQLADRKAKEREDGLRREIVELTANLAAAKQELVRSSPAAWTIQREGEENGPHAALAEALKLLFDAHDVREEAAKTQLAAERAQQAANAVQAEALAAKARYDKEVQAYIIAKQNLESTDTALHREVDRLEQLPNRDRYGWMILLLWIVLVGVTYVSTHWSDVEGWFS